MLMLKLILRLFQENKSYGIKTICIHPLMSRRCTSQHHVWNTYESLEKRPAYGIQDICLQVCSLPPVYGYNSILGCKMGLVHSRNVWSYVLKWD
jgi:hypothetical protein